MESHSKLFWMKFSQSSSHIQGSLLLTALSSLTLLFIWSSVSSVGIITTTDHYFAELRQFLSHLGHWSIFRRENHLTWYLPSSRVQLPSVHHTRALPNVPRQRRPAELCFTALRGQGRGFMRLSDIKFTFGVFISLIPWKRPVSTVGGHWRHYCRVAQGS